MTRPHGSAKADPHNPRAWAICDACGFLYDKQDLNWQFEWFGPRTQNTNMLKCDRCLDVLQEQLRSIVLPSDPEPVANPRPEASTLDNPLTSVATNSIGNMTQGGGLAAIADSATNKPIAFSACLFRSISGNNTVGVSWAGLSTSGTITANGFVAYAPNNAKFFGGGSCTYSFQGSQDNVIWTTLATGLTAGTVGEVLNVSLTPTNGYAYHQLVLTGDGINSVSVAQLQISTSGLG